MAYGGGIFNVQNKVLPGSYINFVSLGGIDANVSERGTVALCKMLRWGNRGMMVLTRDEFQKNASKYLGFDYTSTELWYLREIFKYGSKVLLYNTNVSHVYASNSYGRAAKIGTGGNYIKVEVLENCNNTFTVTTYFNSSVVDIQNVSGANKLKDNAYVVFNKTGTLVESAAGGECMTGGEAVEMESAYTDFLNELENYSFNVLLCDIMPTSVVSSQDYITRRMFEEYTKRRRDNDGVKFQTVMMQCDADYEGIISVKNEYSNGDGEDMVYWTAGVCAGLTAGQSAMNMKYDGELDIDYIDTDLNSAQLENCIRDGQFTFHKVNDEVRVLADINTLVTTTDVKGSVFKENQTVRICDQIANDIAALFNKKYIGRVPNDKAGRLSLWNEIVRFHEQLEQMRAIEDFAEDDITVDQGDTKTSVIVYEKINVVNGMGQLYMTVTVA